MNRRRLVIAAVLASALGGTVSTVSAIGFIDSPAPSCRKAGKGNDCVINWYYMSVDASPNYIVDAWVLIDGAIVAHNGGFFQTSLYVAADRLEFPVKCGAAGTTPPPQPTPFVNMPPYGRSYSWIMRARDSGNLSAANYGTIICPPRD